MKNINMLIYVKERRLLYLYVRMYVVYHMGYHYTYIRTYVHVRIVNGYSTD